ncbi:major facilitator superfamily domain-containing protein [Aspergillus undulatus]|uniref:major facilitator superfamily domain-containing protein n=1 Tax=Aspergillus undulatus TaxID=1810928 RepID=UPI003CCE078E
MSKEEGVLAERDPEVSSANSGRLSPGSDSKTATPEMDEFVLGRRGILAFFTLCVLALMVALDGTSISVALPIMTQDLKGTAIEAFWSGTSFLLASTVFQPNFASLSSIFGRRPLVLIALTLFFVGTVVCSVAKNFTYMLVGRSIQGIGGGGVIALTEVVVTDLVPLRLRGQYFGILSAMWSIGSVTGPILGGGFAQDVTWRWIFYINFPFIGVGVVAIILFLKLNIIPTSLAEKLRQIDYIGTVLFVGSMSSFLIPLTWGGILYDWDSWRTLVPLLIGAAGLTLFAIYEYRFATDPIIPPKIFQNRTATVSFAGSFLQGLVLWCLLYYQPLYYEAVKGYSPIMAGVALFPATFTVAPSAAVVGILVTKYGHYRWAIWLGWFLGTFGLGLLCYMDVETSIPAWIFINLVPGFGLGFLFPSIGFAIQASATNDTLAIAVAMFSFFRAMGQAVGVAIGGVVFQNRMFHNLLRYESLAARAAEYSADAAGLVEVIKSMPEGAEKLALRTAYTDSLRIVYAVCCAVCGVALFLSVFTESYDLNRALVTSQGLRSERNERVEGDVEGVKG